MRNASHATERNEPLADNFGNMENGSNPETIVIVNCLLNAPLMLLSIGGNALVLAAISRTPSIRSTSMIMLCSLAVSDLLVGFVAQPLYVAKELTKDRLLSTLWDTVGYPVCGVSLLIITAISVDRFMALHYHMRYAAVVTASRVRFTIGLIWFTNFLCSSFYFWNDLAYHLVLAIITGSCLGISTFCYIRVYRIVRRHQLQIHAQQQAVENSITGNDTIHMAQVTKSAINTFVFYICMVICYFPMHILLTLHGTDPSYKVWRNEWNSATTFVLMNSSINPFLYCWRLRELRMAVVETARNMSCKRAQDG